MINVFKRYGIAFFILLFMATIMLIGTYFVKKFADDIASDTNMTIKPRGEKIVL